MMRALFLAFALVSAASGAALGADLLSPEAVVREQRKLDAALAALAPQRPGVRDVFIVSAALWDDPVFEREASKGATILAAHFGAQGRVALLSNSDAQAADADPAATPALLDAALKGAGGKAGPEDVLFLFATTHGSPAGLGVRRGVGREATIAPAALAASFNGSGAKTRVAILSACFSGVFIPALQEAGAVVMTAASDTRTSFGCQPENEWTYFGDAFFSQSLARGRPLLVAFNEARALIQMREMRERLKPSNPQIFVGPEAARVLAELEQRP